MSCSGISGSQMSAEGVCVCTRVCVEDLGLELQDESDSRPTSLLFPPTATTDEDEEGKLTEDIMKVKLLPPWALLESGCFSVGRERTSKNFQIRGQLFLWPGCLHGPECHVSGARDPSRPWLGGRHRGRGDRGRPGFHRLSWSRPQGL